MATRHGLAPLAESRGARSAVFDQSRRPRYRRSCPFSHRCGRGAKGLADEKKYSDNPAARRREAVVAGAETLSSEMAPTEGGADYPNPPFRISAAQQLFVDADGALRITRQPRISEIPRVAGALFVFEGEGVGVDDGEFEAQLMFDGVAGPVNAVIHEHLAVCRRRADTGHAESFNIS